MIVQKLKKKDENEFNMAKRYYSIVSVVNDLGLTEREIQLISFAAIKGNISDYKFRDEFCREYNTTTATINNIVSKLKKLKIFLKKTGEIVVNPVIMLDFKKELLLEIKLEI
jgi:hypothetical protein